MSADMNADSVPLRNYKRACEPAVIFPCYYASSETSAVCDLHGKLCQRSTPVQTQIRGFCFALTDRKSLMHPPTPPPQLRLSVCPPRSHSALLPPLPVIWLLSSSYPTADQPLFSSPVWETQSQIHPDEIKITGNLQITDYTDTL